MGSHRPSGGWTSSWEPAEDPSLVVRRGCLRLASSSSDTSVGPRRSNGPFPLPSHEVNFRLHREGRGEPTQEPIGPEATHPRLTSGFALLGVGTCIHLVVGDTERTGRKGGSAWRGESKWIDRKWNQGRGRPPGPALRHTRSNVFWTRGGLRPPGPDCLPRKGLLGRSGRPKVLVGMGEG